MSSLEMAMVELATEVIDALVEALKEEQQAHDQTLKLLNEVANVENVRLQDELTSLRSELQDMEKDWQEHPDWCG